MLTYPQQRPRRLRWSRTLREMVRENHLQIKDLIYPLFVTEGKDIQNPVESMPNIYQFSPEHLLKEVERAYKLGISAIILFGIPRRKDPQASSAYDPDGAVQEAVRSLKKFFPDMLVITDVCLCQYTDHGHCGLVRNGEVLNDETLEVLSKVALSHAEAGADIVAPSDMMDGRVNALRSALDNRGFEHISILSYAVKYFSAFYGPFRHAAESAPGFGDRSSYQMDAGNVREAVKEALLDVREGADMLMVKPALSYLDVVRAIKENTEVPVAAYNVSGEYSMVKAAAERGWLEERSIVLEMLLSMKRAGADLIFTYHALDVAGWLREEGMY